MKFTTTAPDRRTLVKAIAEHTGMEPNYAGPPTFNYTVGTITVDREGCAAGRPERDFRCHGRGRDDRVHRHAHPDPVASG